MPKKINTYLIVLSVILAFLTFKNDIINYLKLTYENIFSHPEVATKKALIDDQKIKHKPTIKLNNQYKNNIYIPDEPLRLKPKNNLNKCLPETNNTSSNSSFTLTTNLSTQSALFLNNLNHKLNLTFKHIENSLTINLHKNIMLDMVFQTSDTDYENYVMLHGRQVGDHQGLYLFPEHIAIINASDFSRTTEIALHEAVHAFNQSYWGYSLRFLNEGMAQYFENITTNGTIPPFDFSALAHRQYPMQISTLLFSDTDWHGDNTNELYQNSKALFYFLMSTLKGRLVIKEIMLLEKENPCSTLPKSTFEEVLFDIFPNHQQAFDYWFSDGVNSFLKNKGN